MQGEKRGKIIKGINNNAVLEGQNSTPTTLKNVGIQISACINVPLNVTYIYIYPRGQWRIQFKTTRTTTKRTSCTNFGKQSRGNPHKTRLTI